MPAEPIPFFHDTFTVLDGRVTIHAKFYAPDDGVFYAFDPTGQCHYLWDVTREKYPKDKANQLRSTRFDLDPSEVEQLLVECLRYYKKLSSAPLPGLEGVTKALGTKFVR